MNSLERFRRKMSISGSSLREEHIWNSKKLLDEVFDDDASRALGVYMWELGKMKAEDYADAAPLRIRFFKREYSAANGVRVRFQTTLDYPIIVGDTLYDSKNDEYYLCTESFNIDDIHWQGRLTLCNWILKWQNKRGDILEYPVHDANTTQYNSGEQSNSQFTIGSSQHMLTMMCDENTVILKTPQRFFLDKDYENPTTFIVTQNDSTTYNYGKKGIVRVTVMECAADYDEDNFELGICDYREPGEADDGSGDGGDGNVSRSMIEYKTTTIKSGGNPQTFFAKFYDEDGSEIDGITPRWGLICPFEPYLDLTYGENSITISIDDDRWVDEDFKLTLTDDEGNYFSSVVIHVDSLL